LSRCDDPGPCRAGNPLSLSPSTAFGPATAEDKLNILIAIIGLIATLSDRRRKRFAVTTAVVFGTCARPHAEAINNPDGLTMIIRRRACLAVLIAYSINDSLVVSLSPASGDQGEV